MKMKQIMYFNRIIQNEYTICGWIGFSMTRANVIATSSRFYEMPVCVRLCVYTACREKRREGYMCRMGERNINQKKRGWIGNGITAESGFTQFDSFAVRDICTRAYKRHRARGRTYARTHAWSSASRYRESAGAVRYGRKNFIYSFTIGPKKRGKYRSKDSDL